MLFLKQQLTLINQWQKLNKAVLRLSLNQKRKDLVFIANADSLNLNLQKITKKLAEVKGNVIYL